MRPASLGLLKALFPIVLLGLTACPPPLPEKKETPKEAAKECVPDPKASLLFAAEVPAGLSADTMAALTAGRMVEGVAQQQSIFDAKIVAVAKDPSSRRSGSRWRRSRAKAHATRPTPRPWPRIYPASTRLRAAGVPNEDVAKVLDTAVKARVPTDDLAP